MINFRFHLASLIAIFLALAVGIFVGSTVIDQAIVENLDRQIDRVGLKADERKAENDRLKSDLDRLDAYVEGSAPFTVASRLDGVPVAVVAERGVDSDVQATLALLRQAGASAPVIVWLEPAWRLDESDEIENLAAALGDTMIKDPAVLRREGLVALVESLAGAGSSVVAGQEVSPTSETLDSATAPDGTDALDALANAGLVSVEEVGGGDTTAPPEPGVVRFLLVGGTESELFETALLPDLSRACADAGAPTVAAEVYAESDGGPDRGAVVSPIVGDDTLAARVTTVDDLDLPEGRVSAVIGLEDSIEGKVGHYGYGSGASRSFPEWTGR